MSHIAELRNKIDNIDEQIQALLTERATAALNVGNAKREKNEINFYRPEREAEILNNVVKRNKGPLKDEDLLDIYRNIIAKCLSLQQELKIAFLGPLGSFSHEAVMSHFGNIVNLEPQTTITNIFNIVEHQGADYGLVPIENSSEGIVNQTLDLLADTPLKIYNEIVIPVHHYLLSRCSDIKNISQVYSHHQGLTQCNNWLEQHLPNAALIPVNSTSQACMLASKEATTAAIASKTALKYYDLNVLAKFIEDNPSNSTRFYVLGDQKSNPTGNDKTTILIWISHQPGALAELLNCFSKNKINLTMIESRPYSHKVWEYIFFIEMEGHQNDEKIMLTIDQLTKDKITYKLLGSYPRAL